MILALVMLLQGCMAKNPFADATTQTTESTTSTTSSTTQEPPPVEIIPPEYTYLSEYATQNSGYLSSGGNPHYLRLINKEFNGFGDAQYVPQNLISLDSSATLGGKEIKLEARAARALYSMLDEMRLAGIDYVRVVSGYRSYEYQEELYEGYKLQEMKRISEEAYAFFGVEYIQNKYLSHGLYALDAEDAETVANYYSARPGTSEHQTGLCIDFMTLYMSALDNSFENYDAFHWLSENAYRFGFILRYPQGKSDVTGYIYEPWHYRYVGREAAAEMHFGNLTLEEYLLG